MENTRTINNYLVSINDLKAGGSLGVVWQMNTKEIEQFNNDNAGYLQAVVIDR